MRYFDQEWNHSKVKQQTPKGNWKFNGVTPAGIIYNLIKRYTKEGDLIVDPMCGSGTTIDVCKEENRKVIGYDVFPTRQDIIQNDSRKIPLDDNSVDMVFIDSPYGDNIENFEKINFFAKLIFLHIRRLMDLSSLKRSFVDTYKLKNSLEKRIFQSSL